MADIEDDPQINLDMHMARNLQNQMNMETQLIMRYRQLKWGNRFYVLRSIISVIISLFFFFGQMVWGEWSSLSVSLFLSLGGYGGVSTVDLVLNLKKKIPPFQTFKENPRQF